MYNYFTELMLNEYFAAGAVFGRFSFDSGKLFNALAKIFLIPEAEAAELYRATEADNVKEIATAKDYMQYRRIKRYELLTGEDESDGLDELINVKGNTLLAVEKFGLTEDAAPTRAAAANQLMLAADSGLVLAMNIAGVLLSEGIIFERNAAVGLKNITRTAMWNSEEGLMAALYYDESRRVDFMARIRAALERASRPEAYAVLEGAYGKFSGRTPKTFSLLRKAFEQGILKREIYSKQYARILFSGLLQFKDKENLFFTPNKELFADAANLPLKLSAETALEFDGSPLSESCIIRESERGEFEKLLGNSDLRVLPTYRPSCIVSDESYVLESCADRLAKCFKNAHVERIEVSDLTEYDLEPTKNNVFIRGCDEDSANVYLLFFRGEISERATDAVCNFLQAEKRKKFRLNHPGVYADLSPVLPVCFSDRENSAVLRDLCDFVPLSDYTAKEKEKISGEILADKLSLYGAEGLSLPETFHTRLAACTIDEMERIIDELVLDNRRNSGAEITEAHLAKYVKSQINSRKTFGFGGGAHEGD